MKDKRLILYMALAFVGMMLWTKWDAAHTPQKVAESSAVLTPGTVSSVSAANNNDSLPPQSAIGRVQGKSTQSSVPGVATSSTPDSRIVTVTTDKLIIKIDRKGGNIISASLPSFAKTLKDSSPVQILSDNPSELYVAQSGMMGDRGPDTREGQAIMNAAQNRYQLQDGQDKLTVPLSWQQGGVNITKTFTFTRGLYSFGIDYLVVNDSGQVWKGFPYAQIRHHEANVKHGMFGLNTYEGAAISSKERPYEKVTYKQMDSKNLDKTTDGGWVAMQGRYFLSAFVPSQDQMNHYFSQKAENVYTIGYVEPELAVAPGKSETHSTKFYVGPEIQKDLEALAPHLGLTIDYGWLWWASQPIFFVMQKIFNIVGNWGWSIILVTLLIKLLFYKFSETSYRSMAKMKKLTPKMNQLKERYGDDKEKLNKAMMELYKKEKVNPMGGCLPMLIQIPVFIALYYVLIESVQLRHAPFMLWIQDLSAKDPYYILPILMGLSMLAQQMMNPSGQMDKTQEMMMKYGLPVIFTVMFMNFPSGLVLYWLVNNILSIAQQELVMRRYDLKDKSSKGGKKKNQPVTTPKSDAVNS